MTLSLWEWEFGEDENGQQQATKTLQEMQTVRKERQKASSFSLSCLFLRRMLKNKEERRESWVGAAWEGTRSVPHCLCFPSAPGFSVTALFLPTETLRYYHVQQTHRGADGGPHRVSNSQHSN